MKKTCGFISCEVCAVTPTIVTLVRCRLYLPLSIPDPDFGAHNIVFEKTQAVFFLSLTLNIVLKHLN